LSEQNEMKRLVPDSEIDYAEDLSYTLDGVPFTGIAYEVDAQGNRSEVAYRDGVQEGESCDWYLSGVLKGRSHFRENTLHGACQEFDEQGNLTLDAFYEYGIVVRSRRYSSDGAVLEDFVISSQNPNFPLLTRYRRERGWGA
jgi:antitoxin component YwqK of YwqJK toxin-antitoxin module